MAKNHQTGFTLVELMVVIGIIAILATIALPQYKKQNQKALDRSAQSDARNYLTAAVTHANR